MNPRTKTFLIFGGIGAVVVFGVGWYLTQSSSTASSSSAPQNAVNPNAQIVGQTGGPFAAQGTMPDIGNLLSYNQPVGGVMSAPQATSVSTGVMGG